MSGKDGITETLLQELEYLRRRVRELESEGLKSEKEKFESFAEASPFGLVRLKSGENLNVTETRAAEQAILRAKEEWELTFNSVQDFMSILLATN